MSMMRALVRHRVAIVAVGCLIATTSAGVWVGSTPTYVARGAVWVLPPAAGSVGSQVNPLLLAGDDAGASVATAMMFAVDGQEQRTHIESRGFSGDYRLALSPNGSTVVEITAEASGERLADATILAVGAEMAEELSRVQDEMAVPSAQRFVVRTMPGAAPVADFGSRDRLLAITLTLGLAAMPVFAMALETLGVLASRRRGVLGSSSYPGQPLRPIGIERW